MKILIFEDDPNDLENIETCISNYFQSTNIDFIIDICQNENMLIDCIDNYDLLFLDIELGDVNGIELGLKIANMKSNCEIIIVSNYKDYLIDGYKINAKRYFIKPINQMSFNVEMDSVIKNICKKNDGFYDYNLYPMKIYFKDIVYIEFVNRKSEIHLENGKVLSSSYPLKHWTNLLKNESFGQPHRSYLVNYKYVYAIENQNIQLSNDEKIPLSRLNRKVFKQLFLNSLHSVI